tara:strand:+ start:77 stop:997 length:921 start_codon:yes stop_codon:yes gene_type:complete
MVHSYEDVKCNLCGADDYNIIYKIRGYNIVKCNICQLMYVNPRLDKGTLASMYDEGYYVGHYKDKYQDYIAESGWRYKFYEKRLSEVEHLCRRRDKILDIGAATGFFLDVARKRGWDTYGVEVSAFSSKYARDKLGLNVNTGDLLHTKLPTNYFDVVTLWDVIEHLHYPKESLLKVNNLLKDGGLLVVDTINIDSFCAKAFKEGFRLIEPSMHIFYFSTRTLIKMLQHCDFEVIKVRYPYFDTPYFKFRELFNLVWRLAILRIYLPLMKHFNFDMGKLKEIKSPPFYGNVVTVFAVKKKSITEKDI